MHSTTPEVSTENSITFAKPIGRAQAASVVTAVTMLVSVFGYLREAALAAHFGVSATMDAYFAATFVPNNIYLILVVGTLSPVFIPLILGTSKDYNAERQNETISVVANFICVLLLTLISLGLLSAKYWLLILFPGFDTSTLLLSVHLTYIIFPSIAFLGLAGILTAVLNAFHRFALAAFAPVCSSVAIILSLVVARGQHAIRAVGFATAIGFLLQFLVLIPPIVRLGFKYVPRFTFSHPAIAQLLRLGGPLFLYLIVANASAIIERNLASRLSTGAVSAISYAIRLFVVPTNFLAAPLAMVSYPQFAREATMYNYGDLRRQLSQSIRFVIVLFLPITVWVLLNALPLTKIVYERGNFHSQDSIVISRVLRLYGIGILPNAINVILLRCCYALRDTLTPLTSETINFMIYTMAALVLTKYFGISGLAVSRGLTFFFVMSLLLMALRKKDIRVGDGMGKLILKTSLTSATMGIAAYLSLRAAAKLFPVETTMVRLSVMGLSAIISGAVFLIIGTLCNIPESRYLLNAARKLIALHEKPTKLVYEGERSE
jgi:putative peptidoglycan lipid II flippase